MALLGYIYVTIGCINLYLMVILKHRDKQAYSVRRGFALLLAPLAIASWPVFLLMRYTTWYKYKKLLRTEVKPFYYFLYSNQIN